MFEDHFRLRDSRVLVTGGAAGIGNAVCEFFASLGAQVCSLDRNRNPQSTAFRQSVVDVTKQDEVDGAIREFAADAGGVDVLVNNAAISFVGTVEDGSVDEWFKVLDVNLLGYVRCIRSALPFLRKAKYPSIVNMSSCSATSGIQKRALYSASKGAVHSLTLAMASDLVHERIRVNCVVPGTVKTPFMEKIISAATDPGKLRREFELRQPTGQMVDPHEVAFAVAYLASPLSLSSVGASIVVDGGLAHIQVPRVS